MTRYDSGRESDVKLNDIPFFAEGFEVDSGNLPEAQKDTDLDTPTATRDIERMAPINLAGEGVDPDDLAQAVRIIDEALINGVNQKTENPLQIEAPTTPTTKPESKYSKLDKLKALLAISLGGTAFAAYGASTAPEAAPATDAAGVPLEPVEIATAPADPTAEGATDFSFDTATQLREGQTGQIDLGQEAYTPDPYNELDAYLQDQTSTTTDASTQQQVQTETQTQPNTSTSNETSTNTDNSVGNETGTGTGNETGSDTGTDTAPETDPATDGNTGEGTGTGETGGGSGSGDGAGGGGGETTDGTGETDPETDGGSGDSTDTGGETDPTAPSDEETGSCEEGQAKDANGDCTDMEEDASWG